LRFDRRLKIQTGILLSASGPDFGDRSNDLGIGISGFKTLE